VLRKFAALFATAAGLLAAGRSFISFADARRAPLPAELKNANESAWLAWARHEDKTIRARLQQGDLDSMVNLLLYGTSFTRQPRISMEGEGIAEASRSGVLRARLDDLVAGLGSPGGNGRLVFLQNLLRSQGIDVDNPKQAGVFLLQNLQRVVEERRTLAQRTATDRSSLFRDRGVSLDTRIIPDYSIEQTLRDLKDRGILREGQVSRVAVIGPGLDFIDKNEASAYDYYPEQTVQPFALVDSLLRLRLAKANAVRVSVLDISSAVLEHFLRARERAAKGVGYTIQLPRDLGPPWPPQLVDYWKSVGDQVGAAIAPIRPPEIFHGVETRAVRIRPDVVLACEPIDLNIILERLNLAAPDRFDLVVATNIFVYYSAFEQTLALENTGAMLKPGGLLLTNDRLPAVPGGSMQLAGNTTVSFDSPGASSRQAVGWYRKQLH
jgi:SAM-dependent methyltransferase